MRSAPTRCPAVRADWGVEMTALVEGLDKAEVEGELEMLVKKGESMPR